MIRDLSSKQDGNLSDYLLSHEQGHFDIAYAISERLNKEIADVRVAAISATRQNAYDRAHALMVSVTSQVVNAYLNELNDATELYDSINQTDHSVNEPEQLQWNAYLPGVEWGTGPELLAPPNLRN